MTQEPGIDILTDPEDLSRADRAGLLPTVARAGGQVRSTVERATSLPADVPRGVLVVGPTAAGDSAVLQALTGPCSAPWVTLDPTGREAPVLPTWVGPLDLVVVLAGDREDMACAEIVAQARYRGAGLVVRGADSGPVADAAGPALISPAIPTPEVLALPGRIALLLQVASACGLTPATDLDAVAGVLDAEALACGPAAEGFTNPALALAQACWGATPFFLGSDPVGRALGIHAAASLSLLAGLPSTSASGWAGLRAPQLIARLSRPHDPFADPFLDPAVDGAAGVTTVPVLIAPPPGAGEPAWATHRALERVCQRALVLAEDGMDEEAALGPADRGVPTGSSPLLTRRTAAALRMALRIDYAAVYLGIAGGQLPPADAPEGLAPAGFRPPWARPATVEGVTGDDRGDAAEAADSADPWDEATWN